MTNHLRITLLGHFAVLRNGQPVNEFAADSARALLAYLALHPGQLQRREHLADLLWPEQTREVNLANLRSTLHRLREALNDTAAESALLDITRQSIGFKATVTFWVDCQEVGRLAAAIRAHQHYHAERCAHCAEQRQKLTALCTGNFLAGVRSSSDEFERWQRGYQDLLHDIQQEMLATLTAFYLHRHDFAAAIATARRQLALEPWNEQAHCQLMQALRGNGQRSAALAQYKRCCAVLQAEFGIQPSATTQALFVELRANSHLALPTLPGAHTLPLATHLHGRQRELTWLRQRLVAPSSRLITVVGMGGVGKTHLATTLARELHGCFADGIWFVDLTGVAAATSPVAVAETVANAIAETLALPLLNSVTRRAQLFTALAPQAMLLILDNFEHLLAGRHLLTELLAVAPHLTILVTSRIQLLLDDAVVCPLHGLAYPGSPWPAAQVDPAGTAEAEAALAIFAEAALRVHPTFALAEQREQVVRICQLVQGLPLALELAAAHVGRLPLATIAQHLAQNLALLSPEATEVSIPQRNLRATLDVSWRLLPVAEQRVFVQLVQWAGELTLAAAQAVAGATAEQMAVLVEHSFLQLDSTQGRYLIHPLLQHYGLEKRMDLTAVGTATSDSQTIYFGRWSATSQQHPMTERYPSRLLAA